MEPHYICNAIKNHKVVKTELVNIAKSFAAEYSSNAVYPAHLFKAVLHKDAGLVHFLEVDLDKDYYYLQEWADVQMSLTPRATRPSIDLPLSDESNTVLDEADEYQKRFSLEECDAVCILASLVTPGVGFSFDALKTLPLTAAEICEKMGPKTSLAKNDRWQYLPYPTRKRRHLQRQTRHSRQTPSPIPWRQVCDRTDYLHLRRTRYIKF